MSDDHEDRITELEARLDAMSTRLDTAEEERSQLEYELQQAYTRIDELEHELDQVEERTDLLNQVDQHNPTSRKERAGLLLQVLYNDAVNTNGYAEMDARAGWENLNRSVDRTAVYSIFDTIVEAVGDEDVAYVQKEDRSSNRNTRLCLDLPEGDVPEQVGGVAIKEGAD